MYRDGRSVAKAVATGVCVCGISSNTRLCLRTPFRQMQEARSAGYDISQGKRIFSELLSLLFVCCSHRAMSRTCIADNKHRYHTAGNDTNSVTLVPSTTAREMEHDNTDKHQYETHKAHALHRLIPHSLSFHSMYSTILIHHSPSRLHIKTPF